MPIFWFCLTAIIGIIVASFLEIPLIFWGLGSVVFLLLGIFEYRYFKNKQHALISHPIFRIPFSILIFGFLLGCVRYQSALPTPSTDKILGYVSKKPIALVGVVKSDPIETNSYITAVVKCESVLVGNKFVPVKGNVSLMLPAGFDIRFGDRIELLGELTKTYENESSITKSSLAQKNIFTQMAFPNINILSYGYGNKLMGFIFRLRERAHLIIFNLMPFPESAVLSGILLGIESEIPEYLWDSYRISGTIHVIAISGFNITIITLISFNIFRLILGWKWAFPSTIFVILFYTLLVGADPPVLRASIMGITALTAWRLGRRTVGVYSLVLTASIMLIGNPFILWSISYQLSFLATLALLTMVDPIIGWITVHFEKHLSIPVTQSIMPIASIMITTFSATLVIFPILFNMNSEFSTISLIANFLIAPFQPSIMTLGGLAVLFGFFVPPNLNIFGMIVWPLIAFCNQIAIRLSISSAAVISLPNFSFWISLIISVGILSYFSYRNIFSLLHPKTDLP